MGSSKKHKDKDREHRHKHRKHKSHDRADRSRSRSKGRHHDDSDKPREKHEERKRRRDEEGVEQYTEEEQYLAQPPATDDYEQYTTPVQPPLPINTKQELTDEGCQFLRFFCCFLLVTWHKTLAAVNLLLWIY